MSRLEILFKKRENFEFCEYSIGQPNDKEALRGHLINRLLHTLLQIRVEGAKIFAGVRG